MTLRLQTTALSVAAVLASSLLTPAQAARPTAAAAVRNAFSGKNVRRDVRALRGKQLHLDRVLAAQAADPHIASVLAHSATNGNYYVVSDLHFGFGKAHPNGAFDRQEDFTRGDVWVKTLEHISHRPGNNTLVIGGDGPDILEHVDPEDSLEKVGDAIAEIVKGHPEEWGALAKAVVNDGLRVVYIRGNHDIRLVDATGVATGGKPIRERFLEEIMNAGNLTPAERDVFKARVAFSGHAAPLGKFGEMMVYHGEQQDPTNSWRNPANPYSYAQDGSRVMPRTLGDQIVVREWRDTERANPDGDNITETSTKVVAQRILHNKKAFGAAAKLLWQVSRSRVEKGDAQLVAEQMDDRRTMASWAKQTGFDHMMNMPLDPSAKPRALSAQAYAKQLQQVYATQPEPFQESMRSQLHTVNVATHLLGKNKLAPESAEPDFLQHLTQTMPNVRFVVSGHDHNERIRIGEMKDRGLVGFFDSGTWTKTGGEDRLNVVVAHTGATGRIEGTPALFRVNPANGAPELPPRAFEEIKSVENWSTPKR